MSIITAIVAALLVLAVIALGGAVWTAVLKRGSER